MMKLTTGRWSSLHAIEKLSASKMKGYSSNHILSMAIIFWSIGSIFAVTAASNDAGYPICTTSDRWLTLMFDKEDCEQAAIDFAITDRAEYGDRMYEFLDDGTPQTTRFGRVVIPRRYTYGTCTIVVAMLRSVPNPTSLPGDPSGPFENTDVLSFNAIYDSIRRILHDCETTHTFMGRTGWDRLGRHGSVGVFVLGTRSQMNRSIPGGPNSLEAMMSNSRNVTKIPNKLSLHPHWP